NNFDISPLTGLITVASGLDFNTQSFYSLSISATDQGRPPKSSSVLVNISIIDINNHNPEFNQSLYTASITEGLALGSAVIQISASDIDSAGLRYQITVNKYVNDTALYSINDTTGLISTASDIDYELTPFTEILVSAIDSGYDLVRSKSVPVQISVKNINDEYPVFDQSEYYVDVIRLLTQNQFVLDINATDPDMIPDSLLTYNISYQSGIELYSIDNATGIVSTLIEIPENSPNSSYILITASDGSLVSMATVHISIIDEGN
ncbi:PREDICTED: cadherin EGF LAG seven-pass G-type receptor 3-like, partial [Amphimedon queenslandica]